MTPSPRRAAAEVRVFAAPGESPDVVEALGREVPITEVDHLSQVHPGPVPAVLLLSAGLVDEGSGGVLVSLPPQVVVLATDARGRRLAQSAGRLFLAAEDLSGEAGLRRGLAAAAAHARVNLALARCRRDPEATDA